MRKQFHIVLVLICLLSTGVFAGGLGHNILILVNANNEESLRIAQAYQQLRHIPDENFIFIDPPDRNGWDTDFVQEDLPESGGSQTQFSTTFRIPIENHLAAHPNLQNQIDYIGMIDMPFYTRIYTRYSSPKRATSSLLSSLDFISASPTNAYNYTSYAKSPLLENISSTVIGYNQGENEAIHHSTFYDNGTESGHYYMGGMVAHTGWKGNSVEDVIRSMTRASGADGTHPVGTVYFEENDDIRSNLREPNWAVTIPELDARGVPWVESRNTPGSTPKNRSDVRGAICGQAVLDLPNGSTYLPGSYADNLTSFGMTLNWLNQPSAKASRFIAAGAAGTAGTVQEPGGTQAKFTYPAIHLLIDDGSTLGEAYYKTLYYGQRSESAFLGDMLAQPYADVPVVQFDGGAPAEGSTVTGTVAVPASASVSTSVLTTAVAELRLYVDGELTDTLSGSNGTLNVDSTAFSDGWHELRVVGMNNSQAASEGLVLRGLFFDNEGRFLTVSGGDRTVTAIETNAVSITVVSGAGTVNRVELRNLGRVLAQAAGSSGSISLEAADLAFGTNQVTAVAVFTDGDEVAAEPFSVIRERLVFASVDAPRSRRTGFTSDYFLGGGGASIDLSDFSGTPDVTVYDLEKLNIGVFDGTNEGIYSSLRNEYGSIVPLPVASPTDLTNLVNLAARYTGYFTLAEAGEYTFFFYDSTESGRLLVDDQRLLEFTNRTAATQTPWGATVFLAAGEHKLEVKMAKNEDGVVFDTSIYRRGPTGIAEVLTRDDLYQAVELPVGVFIRETFDSAALLGSGNIDGNHLWVYAGNGTASIEQTPVLGESGQVLQLTTSNATFSATTPYVSNTTVQADWQAALPSGADHGEANLLLLNDAGEGYVLRAGLDQTGSNLTLSVFTTLDSGATTVTAGTYSVSTTFAANDFQDFRAVWNQTAGTFELSLNEALLGTVSNGTYSTLSVVQFSSVSTQTVLLDNISVRLPPEPAALPFHETFEDTVPMAGTLGSIDGQHGWQSIAAAGATVQTNQAWELNQAVAVESAQLCQWLAGNGSNVWISFAWKPVIGRSITAADVPPGASVVLWMTPSGLTAYSNQTAIAVEAALSTDQWVRVLFHNDYATAQWSLWLDGTLVIDRFGFYTNALRNQIKATFKNSSGTPLYIDDFQATTTAWNPLPGDTDGDGLQDAWERTYFHSPNILTNATGDYDNDGFTDSGEEIAGTDPTDDQSIFQISSYQTEDAGGYVIRWSSVAGRFYSLESRTNLLNGFWNNVESNLPATPPENVYTSPVTGAGALFSRIHVNQ